MMHSEQVWGSDFSVIIEKERKEGWRQKKKKKKIQQWKIGIWVIFNLNCLLIHPSTLAKHYKPKDLIDLEGGICLH